MKKIYDVFCEKCGLVARNITGFSKAVKIRKKHWHKGSGFMMIQDVVLKK